MRTLLVLAILAVAASAHADRAVRAQGAAPIGADDAAAARTRALDDAFRKAVTQLASTLGDPRLIAARQEVFQKDILRRARTYVVRFKVISEGPEGAELRIAIEAVIADGKLAGDLRAAGLGAPAEQPPPPPPPPPRPGVRPALALVLVTGDGERAWATFGKTGDPGPAAPVLQRALEGLGFTVRLPAGVDVPVAIGGESTGAVLDETQAQAAAQAIGAGGVVYGTVRLKDGGPIRGTTLVGVEVELILAVGESAQPSRVWEGKLAVAGFGADARAATDQALGRAAARFARQSGPRLSVHWPAKKTSGAGVEVVFRGVTRWPALELAVRALAAVPGVKTVTARRFSPREVTVLVEGGAAPRALADAVAATAPAGTRFVAHPAAGVVTVDVMDAPPTDPLAPAPGTP